MHVFCFLGRVILLGFVDRVGVIVVGVRNFWGAGRQCGWVCRTPSGGGFGPGRNPLREGGGGFLYFRRDTPKTILVTKLTPQTGKHL